MQRYGNNFEIILKYMRLVAVFSKREIISLLVKTLSLLYLLLV